MRTTGRRAASRRPAEGRAHYFGVSGNVVDLSSDGLRITGLVPDLEVGDPIKLRLSGPGGWLSAAIWAEICRMGTWGFAARFVWPPGVDPVGTLRQLTVERENPGALTPPIFRISTLLPIVRKVSLT